MRFQIDPKQIAPDLLQKLNEHFGQDLSRYSSVQIDSSRASLSSDLSEALLNAAKTGGFGVVMEESKSTPPTAKPTEAKSEVKPELSEGALRLRYHNSVNGLISCENNALAIRNWFAEHPEAKLDAATVDRVVFSEIEHELLWEPQNPGHEFWVRRFNPPPPKPVEPPKPKSWGRLPNGEKRLPIPSTETDLAKASLAQVEDYRDRLRKEVV